MMHCRKSLLFLGTDEPGGPATGETHPSRALRLLEREMSLQPAKDKPELSYSRGTSPRKAERAAAGPTGRRSAGPTATPRRGTTPSAPSGPTAPARPTSATCG